MRRLRDPGADFAGEPKQEIYRRRDTNPTIQIPYGATDALAGIGPYRSVDWDGNCFRVTIDDHHVAYVGPEDQTGTMRAITDWAGHSRHRWYASALEGVGEVVMVLLHRRTRKRKAPKT